MPQVLPYAGPTPQRSRDQTFYLKAIAVIHEVLGGLGVSSAGLALLTVHPLDRSSGEPLVVMFFFSLAILLSGIFIQARRLRHVSIFIALPLGLMFPLGTILAIYTLRLLSRDSVIALYHAKTSRA